MQTDKIFYNKECIFESSRGSLDLSIGDEIMFNRFGILEPFKISSISNHDTGEKHIYLE